MLAERRRGTRPGRRAAPSPTRSRSRGRPPGRNLIRRAAARSRSAAGAAPSSAGSCPTEPGAKWWSCASAAEWNVRAATPLDAERREPGLHHAGGLVGEGDREDLARRERARRDLVGDPPRDRRRLARARRRRGCRPARARPRRRAAARGSARRGRPPGHPTRGPGRKVSRLCANHVTIVRRSGRSVQCKRVFEHRGGPSRSGAATICRSLVVTPSMSFSATSRSSSASSSSSQSGVDRRPGGAHDLRVLGRRRRPRRRSRAPRASSRPRGSRRTRS